MENKNTIDIDLSQIPITEKSKSFFKFEFLTLYSNLERELSELIDRKSSKENLKTITEEDYYRYIGKVYQTKYLNSYLKDLVYIYKLVDVGDDLKQKIRTLLFFCNTALVLNIVTTVPGFLEMSPEKRGELISEGMNSLLSSIDGFEVDFTHDKSTKDTKVKLEGIDEEKITILITTNKPFKTLDLTIKNKLTEETETITSTLEIGQNDVNGIYSIPMELYFDNLENNYSDLTINDIKIKPSKKVGHPSTFFTNSVFYAVKNFNAKDQLIGVNGNVFSMKRAVLGLVELHQEKFLSDPSNRWLSYYLLLQNCGVKDLNKNDYEEYLRWSSSGKKEKKEKFMDLDLGILKLKNGGMRFITVNQNTRRFQMMRNKSAKENNKKTYTQNLKDLVVDIDQHIFESEFEKRLFKKEKEIEKVLTLVTSVASLDQGVSQDEENSKLGDLIGDDSFKEEIDLFLNLENYKNLFEGIAYKVLTPREYFYFILYYKNGLNLRDIGSLCFYQDGSITEIKTIIKKAISKIVFWIKYKNYII